MGLDGRSRNRDLDEAIAIGGLVLILLGFAVYVYPQSFGAFLGAIAAATYPWRFDDREDRLYWRGVAGWSIAAGLALAGAFSYQHPALGVDAELRRFDRQWGPGHLSVAPWIDHPWAWLPLFFAVALVTAGGAILWRAR
jgi:hypothetical protein